MGARSKGSSREVTKKEGAPAQFSYMTPEEIDNRDMVSYQPAPPAFKQIAPDDQENISYGDPPSQTKDGAIRWSGFSG